MKQTVDQVKGELIERTAPRLGGRTHRHFGGNYKLAGQFFVVLVGKSKTDHIGCPIMRQIASIDDANRGIVDQSNRDRRSLDAFIDQSDSDQVREPAGVDRQM